MYGSRAAGYARPDSDIDVLLVLERYTLAIKYAYLKEDGIDVSLLVVSKKSLEADARFGSMGEFAVGRLLNIYEVLENAQLLRDIERTYKRRVILEELQDIVQSTSLLGTEILFPLEFVVFSRIRRRIQRYPNAIYSYYKTYAAGKNSARNMQFALQGYRDALAELMLDRSGIISKHDGLLQISADAISTDRGAASIRHARELQHLVGSYVVYTYASRKVMHLALKEAESKIRRHTHEHMVLPANMESPAKVYWRLPEGALIIQSKDWLDELAMLKGFGDYEIATKRRLGNVNSRTLLYVLSSGRGRSQYRIAVKELARTKSVKWAALSVWTSPVKRFKVSPLFRLGTEYKSIRFLRQLGLYTPSIEAVVLDERLLVTSFIEGSTIADAIRECLKGADSFELVSQAGRLIARIHNAGASLGNIKPKNIIVASERRLYFTDLEQFVFTARDQTWDLAQFLSWGLKGTRNEVAAGAVAREFLRGYLQAARTATSVEQLAKSRRYVESFLPVLAPAVARAIKNEIRVQAGTG